MTAFNPVQLKATILDNLYIYGNPKSYLHEPVISQLILNYGSIVNITGAILKANTDRA